MGHTSIPTAFIIHLVLSCAIGCIVYVPPPTPPWATTTTPKPSTTTTSTEAPCVCGVPNSNQVRIVGGQPAEKNEYPWLVRLVYKSANVSQGISAGDLLCTGSLISSNTVLTPAHCYKDPSSIRAVLKDHDVTQEDGEIMIDISLFIKHPNYNDYKGLFHFDFGIVRLVQHVQFTRTLSPVCLPRIGQHYEGRQAVVTGWGYLGSSPGSTLPDILQEVEVTILTQCTISGIPDHLITDSEICAGKPGKDFCYGDSGAPLLAYEGGGRYFSVVGLASWLFCGSLKFPGLYARVSNQLDWIQDNIEGSTCPAP